MEIELNYCTDWLNSIQLSCSDFWCSVSVRLPLWCLCPPVLMQSWRRSRPSLTGPSSWARDWTAGCTRCGTARRGTACWTPCCKPPGASTTKTRCCARHYTTACMTARTGEDTFTCTVGQSQSARLSVSICLSVFVSLCDFQQAVYWIAHWTVWYLCVKCNYFTLSLVRISARGYFLQLCVIAFYLKWLYFPSSHVKHKYSLWFRWVSNKHMCLSH